MLKRAFPLLTRRVTMGIFGWESTLAVTSNQKKRNFKKRKRVSEERRTGVTTHKRAEQKTLIRLCPLVRVPT